jgi:hypothetical protein
LRCSGGTGPGPVSQSEASEDGPLGAEDLQGLELPLTFPR